MARWSWYFRYELKGEIGKGVGCTVGGRHSIDVKKVGWERWEEWGKSGGSALFPPYPTSCKDNMEQVNAFIYMVTLESQTK